ncbi:hypothetical protein [Bacillus pumilus]|uniref:hypothetical protein n=1 Tax=Bacillus pumilus TaxID=1408 RepID=UPI000D2232A4|nr:hypothetical protein [Bacillus pumilus]AVI42121.1 hypothetical protein C5Y82_14360 [Bacillus pumilus]MBU8640422.1 hypothetical protein [Bacillus pumilus]QHQ77898.1 hypothetical protein GPS65_17925 [Bacillus pumilus]
MDLNKPKTFETTDKAHADLFNEMVQTLLKNDNGLLEQLTNHTQDTNSHASEEEKKKWNDSQIYKITADNGMQLINVSADSKIFDAIKDKGTCTFYAAPGVEDSPTSSNISLRGMQIVGQDNIGAGFAVDISGNSYSFYYNSGHTTITWTPLPNISDLNKWNGSQLIKITNDTGGVRVSVGATENLLDKLTETGKTFGTFYSPAGVQENPSALASRGFYHFTSSDSNNRGTFGWVIAIDYKNNMFTNYLDLNLGWQGWRRSLTEADQEVTWTTPRIINGWKLYSTSSLPVRFSKNALGEVEINGAVRDGPLGEIPVFVLPEGYRPKQPVYYVGVASSLGTSGTPQYHRTLITTDGRVCVQLSSNTVNPTEFIAFLIKFSTL